MREIDRLLYRTIKERVRIGEGRGTGGGVKETHQKEHEEIGRDGNRNCVGKME